MSARSSASSSSCCTFLSLVRYVLACSSCQEQKAGSEKASRWRYRLNWSVTHRLLGLPLVGFDLQLQFVNQVLQPHDVLPVLLRLVILAEKHFQVKTRLFEKRAGFFSHLIHQLLDSALQLTNGFHRIGSVSLFCFELVLKFSYLQEKMSQNQRIVSTPPIYVCLKILLWLQVSGAASCRLSWPGSRPRPGAAAGPSPWPPGSSSSSPGGRWCPAPSSAPLPSWQPGNGVK